MGYDDQPQQYPQQGYPPPNPYQQNPYQQPGFQQPPAPVYQQPNPYATAPGQYQPDYSAATPLIGAAPVQSGGGMPPTGYESNEDKFPERSSYRDPFFGVLFVAHIFAVVALLVVSWRKPDPTVVPPPYSNSNSSSSSSDYQYSSASDEFIPFYDLAKVLYVCLSAAAAAFVFSFLWLFIMKKFARQLIYFTLIAGIIYCLVIAAVGFLYGQLVVGIVFLVAAAINALFFFFWRRRIPFATALLTTVSRVLENYPAPTYVAYISIVVHMLWIVLWVPTLSFVQKFEGGAQTGLTIFLIFSFYWTSQVIKNVVHVTASGLFATWYFLSGLGMPSSPTVKSFKRATTTSFGSICFGSLLVAILKTMRQLVNSARSSGRNNLLICLLACILACLDSLLQYFNLYAFTQVAIYGKSFCHAAKDTWTLIKSHGIDAVINDNLISGVLLMGAIMGGCACGLVGGVVARIWLPDFWIQFALIGFLIGISVVSMAMEVVESGVATIFVCFAMDAPALQRNDPDLHAHFAAALSGHHA